MLEEKSRAFNVPNQGKPRGRKCELSDSMYLLHLLFELLPFLNFRAPAFRTKIASTDVSCCRFYSLDIPDLFSRRHAYARLPSTLSFSSRFVCTSVTYLLNFLGATFFSNISSISAGVRLATSGRMNQAITQTMVPVPAKLSSVSIHQNQTHKKPVLTPQLTTPFLLSMRGTVKLNRTPKRFEMDNPQPAIRARSR